MRGLKSLAPKALLHDLEQLGKAGLNELKTEAQKVLTSAKTEGTPLNNALDQLLPPSYTAHPVMPAYTPLTPAQLDAARARSGNATQPLAVIRDPKGNLHEPLSLQVTGTREQLTQALAKAGWIQAEDTTLGAQLRTDLSLAVAGTGLSKVIDFNENNSPMSPMLVDGQPQALSFEKNDDHHQCRDHIRIYPSGTDAAGRPVWQIAATRDVEYQLNLRSFQATHHIDRNIDRERNMVLADLLNAGAVKDWTVAQGIPDAATAAHLQKAYQTDNQVFLVTLE
jgi:hypothetical protein